VSLDAEENVGEVGDGVDAVHLAGGDERVEAGQVLAGVIVSDEEEVLSSECGDTEGALGGVMPPPRLCRARTRVHVLPGLQRQGGVGNAA